MGVNPDRDQEINEIRKAMGTSPDIAVPLQTVLYEGVREIKVELYDACVNPYKAMFNMATSTWGKHIDKWPEVSPENRYKVVKALLEFKALPSAMEHPVFCFGVERCSRSAFDQIARARLGVVFSCLYSGEHLIETNKGKKKLRDVKVGDKVLTHLGRFRQVVNTFRAYGEERYEVNFRGYGRKVTSTAEHPFLVQRGELQYWSKASELKVGDKVVVLSGGTCEICGKALPVKNTKSQQHKIKFTTVEVKSIERRIGKRRMHYNLEVAEDNSYIASGIVMHNSMGWRDNDHSDIGFRIPQQVYESELFPEVREALEHCKSVYHQLVKKGQANWQDARALIPISAIHRFSMSINYLALRNFCNKRLKFCEQADTVAVAWLMRKRVLEAFPLLGSYLRPSCDARGVCEYHQSYSLSEAFGCLFQSCGRNVDKDSDGYATFNNACTDAKTLSEQLGIKIPGNREDLPPQCWEELKESDRELLCL